jgi:hypothetical protein
MFEQRDDLVADDVSGCAILSVGCVLTKRNGVHFDILIDLRPPRMDQWTDNSKFSMLRDTTHTRQAANACAPNEINEECFDLIIRMVGEDDVCAPQFAGDLGKKFQSFVASRLLDGCAASRGNASHI